MLTARIPELSKWEREESDGEEAAAESKARLSPKNAQSLPPDIVERAEKAILLKPVKPTLATADATSKGDNKRSAEKWSEKSPQTSSRDAQDAKTDPSNAQASASSKDKRSAEPKEFGGREKKDSEERGKNALKEKVKLDRSKFQNKPSHDGSSNGGHRSAKTRSSRRSPERTSSYSPGRRESGSEDSRHQSSPKRERDNRKRKLDEKMTHRGTRRESMERSLLSRQHEQQMRKEGRYHKEAEEFRRRGKEMHSDRSRVRDRSEQEGAREAEQPRSRFDSGDRDGGRTDRERVERRYPPPSSRTQSPKKSGKGRDDSEHAETAKYSSGKGSYRSGDARSPGHGNEWAGGREAYASDEKAPHGAHDRYVHASEPPRPRDRRKPTIDESKFEPNYDMSSDSDNETPRLKGHGAGAEKKESSKHSKRSRSPSPEHGAKKQKKDGATSEAAAAPPPPPAALKSLQAAEVPKADDGDSSSSSSSESGTATPASVGSPAAVSSLKAKDGAQLLAAVKEKHKKKKSKHKKHKKHKQKHKKRKHKKHRKEKEAKAKLTAAAAGSKS